MGRKEVVMPGCIEKKGKGQVCVIASEKQCLSKIKKTGYWSFGIIFFNCPI